MSRTDQQTPLELLESMIPRLRRYALYLTKDPDDADDLLHDSLVKAISGLGSWRRGSNMMAWLLTILRNTFLTGRRRLLREQMTDEFCDETSEAITLAAQEAALALKEVHDAFKKLSLEYRETLILVVIEGLSYEEVADVLEIPIGTVSSRVSRGRTALLELLNESAPLHELKGQKVTNR